MNQILLILGAIGSVASIIGLFKVTQDRKLIGIHAVYLLCIACAVTGYVSVHVQSTRDLNIKNQQLEKLLSPERQARVLLEGDYTHQGFMLAALTFLEKHKEEFPDTYRRAEEICIANGLLESDEEGGAIQGLTTAWKHIDGEYAMRSLLEGIAGGAMRQV